MASQNRVLRWLPLLALLLLIAIAIYFRLYRYLSFAMLQQHYRQLQQWTQQHYAVVALSFITLYCVVVAISFPGAVFLTLAAGFMFGAILGTLYVVLAATTGATLLFLVVRFSLGHLIAKQAQGWVRKLEQSFNQSAFNYLLFLRLVPVFPFWVVNIVPGLLGMKTQSYIVATLLGIIPGTLVYALVGNGLGTILQHKGTPDLTVIFKPSVFVPILALALLSIVPIVVKKIKERKRA